MHTDTTRPVVIDRAHLDRLFEVLRGAGYRLIGPTIRDGAIGYGEVGGVAELPVGWTEEQEAGRYRLQKRTDAAVFGYHPGSNSLKTFLHPARRRLFRAERSARGLAFVPEPEAHEPLAFIGARACELRAADLQERVFASRSSVDSSYTARRRPSFIVAVNCSHVGATCFCASMGTGPRATDRFDLALTEVLDEQGHAFVVDVGSARGAAMLADVPHQPGEPRHVESVDRIVRQARDSMGRSLERATVRDLLYRNLEHPRWNDVSARCLTCANCTMVCPTCFCTTVEDTTDLTGDRAERWQRWDSCFTQAFLYVHGGSTRASAMARYRQWLTHKLATWIDQFGESGCVGCGRCITWCPAGIDITVEVRAIRDGGSAGPPIQEKGARRADA